MLQVSELFKSIQGESTFWGLPCLFIRLAGCNLRCSYCDTGYAYETGQQMTRQQILTWIKKSNIKLVEITGGEPLLQAEIFLLIKELLDEKYQVLVETNGSQDISQLPENCTVIMDWKGPGSGMMEQMRVSNLSLLLPHHQLKFVLTSDTDYQYAVKLARDIKNIPPEQILFSPVTDLIKPALLAEWMLRDEVPYRLQLQLHKFIWNQEDRFR